MDLPVAMLPVRPRRSILRGWVGDGVGAGEKLWV